jgi:hypothetical protein
VAGGGLTISATYAAGARDVLAIMHSLRRAGPAGHGPQVMARSPAQLPPGRQRASSGGRMRTAAHTGHPG